MKKLSFLLLILLSIFFISSCNMNNYIPISNKKKPNNHYYTAMLLHSTESKKIIRVRILQMNFYSCKEMSENDILSLKEFVKGLRLNNFIEKPKDINSRPLYKVFIDFNNGTYVINVYNERYISVQPYDGDFPMDYINMNNIYPSYNIFNLCKYYFS